MDADKQPVTETVQMDEAKQRWDPIVEQVAKGRKRVDITDDGKLLAAVVSARDYEAFRRWEEQRERDFKALDETRAAFEGIPPEEIEREVARAPAAVRARSPYRSIRPVPRLRLPWG